MAVYVKKNDSGAVNSLTAEHHPGNGSIGSWHLYFVKDETIGPSQ